MKLLPHSNGVRKVSMKRKFTTKEKIKLTLIIFAGILLTGFIYQRISNFIAKETLRQRVDYTTVDDKRMDFRLSGEGEYTVVFDGDIGGNLEQWTPVVEALDGQDVNTFVYNRRGYGYSDSGSIRTPEEQAQDLKILLRKSGAPEPYILVGEAYGSLVLTSFAEQFSESVAGVVFINPLNEDIIQTKEYKKDLFLTRIRRKIEEIGSSFGFTTLLDKLDLDVNLEAYENKLSEDSLNEFKTQRTKKNYTEAVYNELKTITKYELDIQKEGVLGDKPYYLLTTDENNTLINLGNNEKTKVHITKSNDFAGLNTPESVVDGINYILKQLKR